MGTKGRISFRRLFSKVGNKSNKKESGSSTFSLSLVNSYGDGLQQNTVSKTYSSNFGDVAAYDEKSIKDNMQEDEKSSNTVEQEESEHFLCDKEEQEMVEQMKEDQVILKQQEQRLAARQEALQIQLQMLGPDHPDVIFAMQRFNRVSNTFSISSGNPCNFSHDDCTENRQRLAF